MKKLLLLASLTLLTLSCSTDELQRDENCYNSEYNYEQVQFQENYIGDFRVAVNGVRQDVPRVVTTETSLTIYLENGEVREYCKALQMAQSWQSNNLQLAPTHYLRMQRNSSNLYNIVLTEDGQDVFNRHFGR